MGFTIIWGRIKRYSVLDFILTVVFFLGSVIVQNIHIKSDYVPSVTFDIQQFHHTQTVPTLIHYTFLLFVYPVFMLLVWASLVFDSTIANLLAAYSFTIAFASFISALLSLLIARPRPDALTVCGGDAYFEDCLKVLSKKEANWMFRSLPSVTVTESVASGAFISMLLFDIWHSTPLYVVILKFMPIIYPIAVAAVEICDRISHVDDVVASAFIGMLIAIITYDTFKVAQKTQIRANTPRNEVLSVVTSYV